MERSISFPLPGKTGVQDSRNLRNQIRVEAHQILWKVLMPFRVHTLCVPQTQLFSSREHVVLSNQYANVVLEQA